MSRMVFDSPRAIAPATVQILAGSVAAFVGSFGVRWAMARTLAPAELGIVALAIAIVSAVGGLASMGAGLASAQIISGSVARGEPGMARRVTGSALRLGLAVGVTAAIAAALGAELLAGALGVAALAPILRVLAPAVTAIAVGVVLLGIARAHGDVAGRALVRDSLGGGLRFGFVGAAALWLGGAQSLAAAFCLGVVLGEGAFGIYVWRRGWLAGSGRSGGGALRGRLAPYFGLEALSQASQWFDTLLLGLLGTPAAVGIYSLARGLSRVLWIASDAAGHRYLPAAAAAHAAGRRDETVRTHSQTRAFTLALVAPAAAPCVLAPAATLAFLFGEEYASGGPALSLMASVLLVTVALGYTDRLLVAVDAAGATGRIRALALGVGIVVGLVTIPRLGALGAAVAWSTYLAVQRAVEALVLWRSGLAPPWDGASVRVGGWLLVGAAAGVALERVVALPPWARILLYAGVVGVASLAALRGLHRAAAVSDGENGPLEVS